MFIEPYLSDKNFLKELDLEPRRVQYLKIEVLDFKTEEKKASIAGIATGGTANLNGSSNMRRVANCTLTVNPDGLEVQGYQQSIKYNNITEIENLISLNKKIRLYSGLENVLDRYEEYPIIWFPIGTFMIKAASVSGNASGVNISLTLNDKCALLNGDMGGMFPAATVLSELEVCSESGARTIEKIPLRELIYSMVINYGGEKAENIIISDLPVDIVKVVKWNNPDFPIYLIEEEQQKRYSYTGSVNDKKYQYGENIGYTLEPFVYPGTLEAAAGETVAAM